MGTIGEGMEKLPEGMSTNAAEGFERGSTLDSNGQAGGDQYGGRGRHERTMHAAPIQTAAKIDDAGEMDMAATMARAISFIPDRLLP